MTRKIGMTERPIATSYEIICALERMPPRNGYFEFEAQPASTMPYTLSDASAKTSSTPIPTSAMTPETSSCSPNGSVIGCVLPNGTTQTVKSAGSIASAGASQK